MLPRSVVPKVGPARLTCFFFLSALRLLKAQIFNTIYPHQKTRRRLQLRADRHIKDTVKQLSETATVTASNGEICHCK